MEKVKAFFKKVGSVIYDLFIASNRWMHVIIGGIIMVFMCAATVIWYPYEPNPMQAMCVGTLSTFIAMCAVEYKDKAHGGLFDWKDILAGMIVPIIMSLLSVIMILFK